MSCEPPLKETMLSASKAAHFQHLNPGVQFPKFKTLAANESEEMRTRLKVLLGLPSRADSLTLCFALQGRMAWSQIEATTRDGEWCEFLHNTLSMESFPFGIVAFQGLLEMHRFATAEIPRLVQYSGKPGWAMGDGFYVLEADLSWSIQISDERTFGWTVLR